MSKTTELVERLRELPRDTHKATLEIYDLCVEASYKIEELTDRCARYAEEIAVLQEEPKRAAAAGAAPVAHGRWDGEGDGYADGELVIDVWYCSRCGHCIDDGTDDPAILPNYCPNCGAKMDGGGERDG